MGYTGKQTGCILNPFILLSGPSTGLGSIITVCPREACPNVKLQGGIFIRQAVTGPLFR